MVSFCVKTLPHLLQFQHITSFSHRYVHQKLINSYFRYTNNKNIKTVRRVKKQY